MRPEGIRLPAGLRVFFYAVFTVLFLSGALWWIGHTWLRHAGEFGSEPAAWESSMLKLHGAAAMLALLLFGVLYPIHLVRGWKARRNRTSGGFLVLVCAILIVTGYLLYYVGGESARAWASNVHLWLGLALPALIVFHIWRGRRSRSGG